jgi:N-ethylmaleimide reductase
LELDEIPGLVEQFRQGAQNAKEAGFDGVEIHAANGYLLDQFLRDGTNRRADRYGGSPENRFRLLSEVVEAVSGVWGADRVGVRISPVNPFNDIYDSDPETTFGYAAERLNRFGLAYLHVVEIGTHEDDNGRSNNDTKVFNVKKLRSIFNGPYIANGGYGQTRAEAALSSDETDLIAFGSLYIANPDLVERFRVGAALNDPDPNTFYGGDERGYTDYPFLHSPAN